MNNGGPTPLQRPKTSSARFEEAGKSQQGSLDASDTAAFHIPRLTYVRKQNRVVLSSETLKVNQPCAFRLFAVANSKGWFVAATNNAIIMSPLQDLQGSLESDDKVKPTFQPQRTVPLPAQPNIVTFVNHESQLAVGLLNGEVCFYATDQLFSSGNVSPLHVIPNPGSPARQIVPNPSTDAGIRDLLAIVRLDGRVEMINSQFQSQGGWTPTEKEAQVNAASWSPKGKQIALGLMFGDILTFSPTNKAAVQKHIPPTFFEPNTQLVSLNWLPGLGYTFRVSYFEMEGEKNTQHTLVADKSDLVKVTDFETPYLTQDRPAQATFTVVLPRWDEDGNAGDPSRCLFIVSDIRTVDLGIYGHAGSQWFHYPDDSPTLPLNEEDSDDTTVLSLDVDLVNSSGTPILYAYLNDGTIHAWNMNVSKPYAGMVGTSAAPVASTPSPAPQSSPFAQPSSSFGQAQNAVPFGQPQHASSAIGQPSAFGSAPSSSSFGHAANVSAFGSSSSSSSFGERGTAFGGGGNNNSSPFGSGGSAFGGGQQSAFGSSNTLNAFGGSGGSSSSAFGSSSAFDHSSGSGFGNNNTSSAFGNSNQTAFGSNSFGPRDSSQEDSMAEDTPGFGGLSLGGNSSTAPKTGGGVFGSPAPLPLPADHPANQQTSAFSSALKPASGFGAFGAVMNEDSPFAKPKSMQNTSSFASALSGTQPQHSLASASPAFGQTSFGAKPAFGQPSFGQSGFGQRVAPPAPSKPTTGGFGAFASGGPVSMTAPVTKPTSGGFGSFASTGPASMSAAVKQEPNVFGSSAGPSSFGAQTTQEKPAESPKPASGFSSFASSGPSAFSSSSTANQSSSGAFGVSSGTSALGSKPDEKSPVDATKPATGFGSFASQSPSPFGPGTTSFGNTQTSSEEGKPATGFGAFASMGPSAFGGNAAKPEEEEPSHTLKPGAGLGAFASQGSSPFGSNANNSPFAQPTTPSTPSPQSENVPPIAPLKDSPFGKGPAPNSSSDNEPHNPKPNFGIAPLVNSPFGNSAPGTGSITPQSYPGIAPLQNSPFGKSPSPTPASPSPFSASPTGAPKGNAFTNMKINNTYEPGFGAFGGSMNNSSPFFKAAENKTPAVSAFSNVGDPLTTPTRPAATATPIFGAPTSLGVKSAFAPQTPPTPATTTPTKSNAFGSYTGTQSAFGKAAEKKGSFQDLLSGKSANGDPGKPSNCPPTMAPRTTVEDTENEAGTSTPVFSKPDKGKGKAEPEPLTQADGSFSSVASSYVDVAREQEGGDDDDDDDADSFISQSIPSVGDLQDSEPEDEEEPEQYDDYEADEVPDQDDGEQEEQDDEQRSPTPSAIPLPLSRSPTATPSLASSSDTVLPTIVEETTTPPGSPEKKTSPIIPLTTPLPSSLGLGRPSTKPTRSSPLATAVSGSDDEDDAAQPVAPKPRPASPKTPFGVLPLKTEPAESSSTKARPKTPPLLSAFGPGGGLFSNTKPSTSAPAPTMQVPASTPPPKSTPFSLPAFGSPSSPSPFVSPSPTEKSAPGPPPMKLGPFSSLGPPPLPSGGLFGKTPQSTPPQPQQVPQPSVQAPAGPKLDDFHEGMQRECARVYAIMCRELDTLRVVSHRIPEQQQMLSKRLGGTTTKAGLGDVSRWAPADAVKFGNLLVEFSEDLESIRDGSQVMRTSLKELGSGLVKANTRKEEIERFNRAKEDDEFKKMLKSRTLGPELIEMKSRLRGDLMRRKQEVLKLEDILRDHKKKMMAMKSQKGLFRAPSLDTVNRTYRNIDAAIRQEQNAIESLSKRFAAVKIAERSLPPASTRTPEYKDPRLPDAAPRRPSESKVSYEAMTTAAALNAERSAQKLKNVLLGMRQQPLLNETKLSEKTPVAFLSASQATAMSGVSFGTPIKVEGSLFSDMNEDNFQPGSIHSPSVVRRTERKVKHTSVPLSKKTGTGSPAPAPSFDWGPAPQLYKPSSSGLVMGFGSAKNP